MSMLLPVQGEVEAEYGFHGFGKCGLFLKQQKLAFVMH